MSDATGDDDPWPLRGGICRVHGEFNNFSGRCLTCQPTEAPTQATGTEQKQ